MTLVQQRMRSDCAVAALAMFLGVEYDDVARHCTGSELIDFGLSFFREQHIARLFGKEIMVLDRSLLDRSKPAILSVPSLNDMGTHAVFWNGRRVFDPQHGRKGKRAYTNQMVWEVCLTGIIEADRSR